MTPNLTAYTTDELTRLTTLTLDTMKPGEFVAARPLTLQYSDPERAIVSSDQSPIFKLVSGSLCHADGRTYASHTDAAQSYAPRRRVTSFTDTTERDPSQAEMLAELTRRTLRFRKGDQVARDFYGVVYIGRVRKDCTQGDDGVLIDWDARQDPRSDPDYAWMPSFVRLATPADIAAYEARIPKAPVFTVGELVVANGETRKVSDVPTRYVSASWATSSDIVWLDNGREPASWIGRYALRPATDAEVAAYHRAHCQGKVEPVKPTPPISNATHAGKAVHWFGGTKVFVVADLSEQRIVPPTGSTQYVTLVDPAMGSIYYCYNQRELTEVAK